MSRLIFIIALAAVVYLWLRSRRRPASPTDKITAEDMVRCAQCGVHLPKGESIKSGERFFCSTEDRDAYHQ